MGSHLRFYRLVSVIEYAERTLIHSTAPACNQRVELSQLPAMQQLPPGNDGSEEPVDSIF